MRIKQLNEQGYLRWVDGEDGELRFRYSNRFYGECNLRLRIRYGHNDEPRVDRQSVTVEQIQPSARGDRLLRQAALRFLRQAMLRQPELFSRDPRTVPADESWWKRLARRWRVWTSSVSTKA